MNSLLVALKKNGDYLSLLNEFERNELIKLRDTESFLCPACREAVQLKLGKQRMYHFAHIAGSGCKASSEQESRYHLYGKKYLHDWLVNQSLNVEIEPYLKQISQRPDLLVEYNRKKYAIEFQCSTIEPALFTKRTNFYRKIEVQPIWILGAKKVVRKSANSFRFSSFQWLFMRVNDRAQLPIIYYFCPETCEFLVINQISPFTSTEAFGTLHNLSTHQLPFSKVLHFPTTQINFTEQWNNKKKRWRVQFASFPSKTDRRFVQELYQAKIPPSYIPAEAGLPVKSMYWIETPAIIWQMWILLDNIINKKIGEIITFQSVYQSFLKRRSTRCIKTRTPPLIDQSHFSFAVMEYLQTLTNLHILTKIDKKTFKKMNDCKIPNSLEEAFVFDQEVIRILK